MKKFCNLLFLIVFCVVLTGCTRDSKQVKLQFASWGSQSEIKILNPILEEFREQNPDINLEFVHIPQNYFEKLHLLFASNLAPDVVFINNLYLPIYAKAGLLEEIPLVPNGSPLSSEGIIIDASAFWEKSLEAMSYNGKLYAIPRDVSNLVIYYNKDLFKKYEVPLPSPYWSFDDFLILAKKLTLDTNNDGKTDIWGISFEETPALFYLPYLMSEGGGIVSDDLSTIIINYPESQKGLKFYADLRNKYHVAPTKAESASETMAQMFLEGKLAMQLSGRWLVPKYREEATFEWNVVNFPSGDAGSVVPLDASGWAVAKSSKHKAEAMRLIDFLSSKKNIEKISQSGLIVPARIDAARSAFLNDTQAPKNNHIFLDVIKTSKPTPVPINYSEIQDDLKQKTDYLFNK